MLLPHASKFARSRTPLIESWNRLADVCDSRVKLYSVNKSKPATAKRLQQLEDHGASIHPITRPLPFDLQTDEEYLEEMKKQGGRDPVE